MSVTVGINVNDQVSAGLGEFINKLRSRAGLHQALGRRVLNITRDHLINIAGTRHDTANRLGATPSGHWAQAAEKTSFTANSERATLIVKQPGITRAFRDVTITPGAGKKALTIPVIAEAYNQRAYRVPGLFVLKRKEDDRAYLAKGEGDDLKIWYVLKASVLQKKDRTLLPSDEHYQQAALEGALDYVNYLVSLVGRRDTRRGFNDFIG